MCCAFFWLNAHPQLLLLLAFNRDEFLDRSTDEVHVWEGTDIIAGRDRMRGGTWLGLTRSGRFAFVTNVREVNYDGVDNALSRGALPTAYLTSDQSPEDFAAGLDLQRYNGLNLVVGDLGSSTAVHVSNRGGGGVQRLGPGVHGVSNVQMGASGWPKVQTGEAALQRLLDSADLARGQLPWDGIFSMLGDAQRPAEAHIPRTGVEWEMDVVCSSIFVPLLQRDNQLYGTRSQTVAAVWASGQIEVQERSLSEDGKEWKHATVTSALNQECNANAA